MSIFRNKNKATDEKGSVMVKPKQTAELELKNQEKSSFTPESIILKKPIVTEKAMTLEEDGWYVFKVSDSATKPVIKKAVERTWGVKVQSVGIMNVQGKRRFSKGREGWQPGFKKAMVKLEAGYKIEIVPH